MTAWLLAAAVGSGLEFHDVNILAVTDTHSWIAGGDKQVTSSTPPLDATFGDLVSFAERAKDGAKLLGKDVFLVDNGDVVDGTGISNFAEDHCAELLPLLARVPFDALNCGNHELYHPTTMEHFTSSGYISDWGGKYLTSNVINATTLQPLGSQYRVIVGPNSGVRLLTFGFMYDMSVDEGRCTAVNITSVEETVQPGGWFGKALADEGPTADAILILAHMDAHAPLLTTIVQAIRAQGLPSIPIQIIAGHSHRRLNATIDPRAGVFEPGNYFNTIGFASFDLPPKSSSAAINYSWVDIDTSTDTMATTLGLASGSELPTPDGVELALQIQSARDALNLTKVLGCAKQNYYQGSQGSLNKVYFGDVLPTTLFLPPKNKSQWFVQSTGSLRYSLYQGNVTADDIYKILPFEDQFFVVKRVLGSHLRDLWALLNSRRQVAALADVYAAARLHGARSVPPTQQGPWRAPAALADTLAVAKPSKGGRGPGLGKEWGCTEESPGKEEHHDCIFSTFDVPVILAALKVVTGNTTDYEAMPFRPGETDTKVMTAWVASGLGGSPCPA